MDAHPIVSQLTVAAIKGLTVAHPDQVEVTGTGIARDRQFFLVDAEDKLLSASRTGAFLGLSAAVSGDRLAVRHPGGSTAGPIELGAPVIADFYKYKDVPAHEVLGPWSALFSELAGRPVRLVRADAPNGGCDVHPLTLLGDASVRELAEQGAIERVDTRRFRMSIGFDGAPPHAEDDWGGRVVAIGTALVRVGGAVPRCAATTRHPDRGDVDLKTMHLLKGYRGVTTTELGRGIPFGVYADVVAPGVVRVGDPIIIEGMDR